MLLPNADVIPTVTMTVDKIFASTMVYYRQHVPTLYQHIKLYLQKSKQQIVCLLVIRTILVILPQQQYYINIMSISMQQ